LAYESGAVVTHISATPHVAGLANLIGKHATTGFRATIDEATGAINGQLAYLLLDETPVATLVAGYSVVHATSRGEVDIEAVARLRRPGPPIHGPNMCAGYRVGSSVMLRRGRGEPVVVTGPEATPILDGADPVGWHAIPLLLPSNATRRWRRHDLWRDVDGTLRVDIFFRDSHMAPDGFETIIHEYTVEASIDGRRMMVLECVATPHVLPFIECPEAAVSARRLEGMSVRGLRRQVRADLVGPSACTHLTDTLREIEDVLALEALLPAVTS
jgi:hypothetical protein